MAAARGQGPPQRVFIIERQPEEGDHGAPMLLHFDEQAKKLILSDKVQVANTNAQFVVDTDGFIQVVGQGANGFLTRSEQVPGPVTLGPKDLTNPRQRWNFKAGPPRQAPDPPPPQAGGPNEHPMQRFTLAVSPMDVNGQAHVLQARGAGMELEVVQRTGLPEMAPAVQAFNFAKRGAG